MRHFIYVFVVVFSLIGILPVFAGSDFEQCYSSKKLAEKNASILRKKYNIVAVNSNNCVKCTGLKKKKDALDFEQCYSSRELAEKNASILRKKYNIVAVNSNNCVKCSGRK